MNLLCLGGGHGPCWPPWFRLCPCDPKKRTAKEERLPSQRHHNHVCDFLAQIVKLLRLLLLVTLFFPSDLVVPVVTLGDSCCYSLVFRCCHSLARGSMNREPSCHGDVCCISSLWYFHASLNYVICVRSSCSRCRGTASCLPSFLLWWF